MKLARVFRGRGILRLSFLFLLKLPVFSLQFSFTCLLSEHTHDKAVVFADPYLQFQLIEGKVGVNYLINGALIFSDISSFFS